jgi:hypothetical protein
VRILLATILTIAAGCAPAVSVEVRWRIGVAEVVDAGRDLAGRVRDAAAPTSDAPYFAENARAALRQLDQVDTLARAGYAEAWPTRRLAGYALWISLTDAALLAKRGVLVDATRAVDACVRLSPIECDPGGWERAVTSTP